MKMIIVLSLTPILLGCGKSDDDLRATIRSEMARASARSFVTNGQVIGPYTPAVKVGGWVFVSGQIGIDPTTAELAGSDIETQTRQALSNLLQILRSSGCDSSAVVQCSVYLRDIRDFQSMNRIYGGYFGEGSYPARTTVEVSNLPKNARIEIAAIAWTSR